MRPKLLIDECLSVELVRPAHRHGFQATCVRDIERLGASDPELASLAIEGDWCFVTNNAAHFRGPKNAPGTSGEYAGVPLHAGLICLHNGAAGGFTLDRQRDAFLAALDAVLALPNEDMTNLLVEATWSSDEEGGTEVTVIEFPAEQDR